MNREALNTDAEALDRIAEALSNNMKTGAALVLEGAVARIPRLDAQTLDAIQAIVRETGRLS